MDNINYKKFRELAFNYKKARDRKKFLESELEAVECDIFSIRSNISEISMSSDSLTKEQEVDLIVSIGVDPEDLDFYLHYK